MDPAAGLTPLIVGFVLSCIGAGPIVKLGTSHVIGAAPPEKAGAAGMSQTCNELGTALGTALLGSLITAVYRDSLGTSDIPAAARDSLPGATGAAQGMSDQAGNALLATAHAAFADGLQAVAVVSAVALLGFAALLAVTLRHLPALGAQPAESPQAEGVSELA